MGKEVWIEEEAIARKWRDWEDLDSGNWVVKEKDAEGKLAVRDLVVEFMSKIIVLKLVVWGYSGCWF